MLQDYTAEVIFLHQFLSLLLFFPINYFTFSFVYLQRWRVMKQMNTKSISEKFPPPHQDATMGYPRDASKNGGPVSSFSNAADDSFNSTTFDPRSSQSAVSTSSTSGVSSKKKNKKGGLLLAPSRRIVNTLLPSSVRLSLDLRFKGESEPESENFQPSRRG